METNFLIIGDLHGKIQKELPKGNYHAILCPGDLGKFDEIRKIIFKLIKENNKQEWYDYIGLEKAKRLIMDSLASTKKVMQFLDSFNIPVFIVPGNIDLYGWRDTDWAFIKHNHFNDLINEYNNIVNIDMKIANFRGIDLIGYGCSSKPEITQHKELKKKLSTQENKEEKKSYEIKSNKLNNIFKKSKNPIIFLSHNVPFNSKLDKINSKESPLHGYHFGSIITRELIEKYQPIVSIGGHIHENFKSDKIRDTLCLNSGTGASGQMIKLTINDNQVTNLEFIGK